MKHNPDFQLGLLHFVHLLVTVDGRIDDRERAAITAIRKEEGISDEVFATFEKSITENTEMEIYTKGVQLPKSLHGRGKAYRFCALVSFGRVG